MENLIWDYREVQQIARETIEYAKTFIKPGINLLEVRKLCEQKMLELGADSFWYWDIGAFVFAGDETTVSVSGKQYVTSDRIIENNDIITKYSKVGIPMSMPVGFGICNQNKSVYMILTWVEGQDLESILPKLPEKEQYELGRLAGSILKKIHGIPLEERDVPVNTKLDKKLLQLSRYEKSNIRIEDDETAVEFVKQNIHKIWKEKPVYQHGDFHPGNLIYLGNGEIGVIDFERWEVGDPYEEFYKLESFARELSITYCIGQIQAYFDDDIPEDFWSILAVYVAHASLFSIKWAEKFGQKDIDSMTQRCMVAFKDYDYFRRTVPVWYEE